MKDNIHILVEKGNDAGKEFSIPVDGARIGRSANNDIIIDEPEMSRDHCRILFKEGALWIVDHGSANETLLNDKPVAESPICPDDRITIGNTVLRVISDGRTPSPEPKPLQLKTAIEIPGYTILSKLGEGATAAVWMARQESLDRPVAIKILKKQLSENSQDVEDFINEAKSVAKIKSRNIIQVIDVGQHNGTFYLVMEYVEGVTLGQTLTSEGRLDQKRALSIAAAIASGLDDAWGSGKVIHRDIKPDNIMLEKGGVIKIADLGLASILDNKGNASHRDDEIVGTPNYMAPEQGFDEGEVDCRADMYSLGCTLYHMVTGVMPFNSEDNNSVLEAQKSSQLANPRDINSNITPGCAQIITKLMMKKAKYRFRDWSTVEKELSKLASGKLVVSKVPASADSTIAKPGEMAPAVGSRIEIRKPQVKSYKPPSPEKQERLKELKKKYTPQRAPVWLRIPLELALLGWFGCLAYQLLWVPSRPEPAPPTSHEVPPTPALPELPTFQDPPSTANEVPEPPTPNQVATSVPQIQQPTKPDIPESTAPDETRTIDIRTQRDIVNTLLSEGPAGAQRALQTSNPTADDPRAAEITKLLANAALTPEGVAENLRTTIGTRITLALGSNQRHVEIISVVDQKVTAKVFSSARSAESNRTIEFRVTQLDPVEQSRILGPPTQPERALAKFVLHMNAGDYINARQLAEQCGPLADACIAETDARIQMLVE